MFFRRAALGCLLLVLGGCGDKREFPANRRLAIRRIENLGAERSADRLAGAVTDALIWRALAVASPAADEEQARQSGAGMVLRGQWRAAGAGKWRLTLQLQDRLSTAMLGGLDVEVADADAVPASCRAAETLLRMAAGDALTGDCGLQREWLALQGDAAEVEAALAQNPKFYAAYPRLAQEYVRAGKADAVAALIAKLGEPREGSVEQFVAGQLRLLGAKTPGERAVGYVQMLGLRAADPRLRQEAAEFAQATGDWAVAAGHWKKMVELEPGRALSWNSLGYAEAQRGKTDEAVRAILEYQKRAPGEANPLDSLGEVQYMGRRFRDAAVAFDELNRKHPGFQGRAGLWKAAIAWYKAGDLAQADKRHAEWLLPLEGRLPPSAIAFQKAYWLARTGRMKEYNAFWEQELAQSAGERQAAGEMYRAAIEFGLNLRRPPDAQFVAWSKQLSDPRLRQEFSLFGLLSDNAGSEAAWRQRLGAAGAPFLPVALELWTPLPAEKPSVEPLPENPPGMLEALRLRRRTTVLR